MPKITRVEPETEAPRKPSEAELKWQQETLEPWLQKFPELENRFTTLSGVPVNRLYTPADLADFDYARDLADPGEFPFTRGIHDTMYRGRLWTMRQFSG